MARWKSETRPLYGIVFDGTVFGDTVFDDTVFDGVRAEESPGSKEQDAG